MSNSPRTLKHPGPVARERVQVSECRVRQATVTLKPGLPINESIAQAVGEAGAESAYLRLDGASIDPLRYFIPAASPDEDHAAWWSETYAPFGGAVTLVAGVFLGRRDGKAFTHCHGVWQSSDTDLRMGHLVTTESITSAEVEVPAWLISGALLEASDDEETNFRLFAPRPDPHIVSNASTRGLLCTIRPNVDLASTIVSLCQRHGFGNALIHGIGSLAGTKLRDGREVDSFVTEVLIEDGHIGDQSVSLEVASVGADGHFGRGILDGENHVGVTFELLIEEM